MKLSQEFSRAENRILGAILRSDDFLMKLLIQGHSGTTPEMSRNTYCTNQGTNEDDSQSDPHPEPGIWHNQTTRNSGPEDGHDSSVSSSNVRVSSFLTPNNGFLQYPENIPLSRSEKNAVPYKWTFIKTHRNPTFLRQKSIGSKQLQKTRNTLTLFVKIVNTKSQL